MSIASLANELTCINNDLETTVWRARSFVRDMDFHVQTIGRQQCGDRATQYPPGRLCVALATGLRSGQAFQTQPLRNQNFNHCASLTGTSHGKEGAGGAGGAGLEIKIPIMS